MALAARGLRPPLRRIAQLRRNLRACRERHAWLLLPLAVLAALHPGPTLRLLAGAWTVASALARLPAPEPAAATARGNPVGAARSELSNAP